MAFCTSDQCVKRSAELSLQSTNRKESSGSLRSAQLEKLFFIAINFKCSFSPWRSQLCQVGNQLPSRALEVDPYQ